jgi:hypothetical protein
VLSKSWYVGCLSFASLCTRQAISNRNEHLQWTGVGLFALQDPYQTNNTSRTGPVDGTQSSFYHIKADLGVHEHRMCKRNDLQSIQKSRQNAIRQQNIDIESERMRELSDKGFAARCFVVIVQGKNVGNTHKHNQCLQSIACHFLYYDWQKPFGFTGILQRRYFFCYPIVKAEQFH